MDQSYAAYAPIMHLVHDAPWHHRIPVARPSLFPDHSPDLEYPSPALSNASPSYVQDSLYATHMTDNNVFAQVESSIGPTRAHGVTTRRQALAQKIIERQPSLQQRLARGQSPRPSSMPYPATARLLTSNNNDELRHARPSLTIPNPQPSYDPMTPSSTPSPYTRPFDSSRAVPDSAPDPPRIPSPALSCVSALTSVSAASHSHPYSPYPRPSTSTNTTTANDTLPVAVGGPSRPKQKKQRLDNNDRKRICRFHEEHPNCRQEDIASEFGVERSTISKILKQKSKWLSAPDTPSDRISKHRPSKFPEVEEELRKWLESCTLKKMAISDSSIRDKAREIARTLNIPEEKFKASSGWVENFKSRQNIRGGIWQGGSKNTARLIDGRESSSAVLSPLNPAFSGRATLESMSPEGDEMRAETSPQPEQHATPEQHMSVSSTMSSGVPWAGHTAPSQGSPISAHSRAELPASSLSVHRHPTDAHLPSHQLPEGSQEQYMEQTYYTPIQQHIPTLAEAEDHINALIAYLDKGAREDLITDDERQALSSIKIALFQEAHQINPFTRST